MHGTALLYADNMTGSMERAIEETSRRRERQLAFNEKHGIKPASIVKQVADIMEAAYPVPGRGRKRVAEDGNPLRVHDAGRIAAQSPETGKEDAQARQGSRI